MNKVVFEIIENNRSKRVTLLLGRLGIPLMPDKMPSEEYELLLSAWAASGVQDAARAGKIVSVIVKNNVVRHIMYPLSLDI
jgi:hypothetical protein